MQTWTSKCLLGDPLDPRITKMVSQVPKMEPQGSKMTVLNKKSDNSQQSTSQQLPVARRGPAAGGEALEYIYIYIYIYICEFHWLDAYVK